MCNQIEGSEVIDDIKIISNFIVPFFKITSRILTYGHNAKNSSGTISIAYIAYHFALLIKRVGLNIIVHSIYFRYAPVAQLDRVPDFESVGRRFESCRAHHC